MKINRASRARILSVAGVGFVTVCVACLGSAQTAHRAAPLAPKTLIDVTVSEGTSMSVAVSPDGKTLAIDLQGSIWTLPATGGTAKRITGLFNDARQPAWSPDGKWIAFFGYLDGGYDLWTIAPDGSNQHKLTWGSSTIASRLAHTTADTSRLRPTGTIRWGAATTSGFLISKAGRVKRVTNDPSENHMPTWSPDDKEIAFSSTREGGNSSGL